MPFSPAQRRPGPRPRRHSRALSLPSRSSSLNEGRGRDPGDTGLPLAHDTASMRLRSTKAGAETPATPSARTRHRTDDPRSTKAGAETPATPGYEARYLLLVTPLNEGRGRDPGDTRNGWPVACASSSLNEGRGRDPGDTISFAPNWNARSFAQRRPGPRPRRHHQRAADVRRKRHRSTKAGAETPATRPYGPEGPGAHARSTKAGAETPATLAN